MKELDSLKFTVVHANCKGGTAIADTNAGQITVHDPTGEMLNEPVVNLVGRMGRALYLDGRWVITTLCCSVGA